VRGRAVTHAPAHTELLPRSWNFFFFFGATAFLGQDRPNDLF
jgi:hypothetical protein